MAGWAAGVLHLPIEAAARRWPDRVALTAGGHAITYRGLMRRSERLAARLRALGVGPEVRVALFLDRSADAVAALLAVLQAGGAYVPVEPSLPPRRISFLLADSGAAVILSTARLAARLEALDLDASAGPARLLLLDRPAAPGTGRRAAEALAPAPDNLAYLIYTSGSTGTPKAVAVSHRAIARHMAWFQGELGVRPDDVVLHKTVLSFDPSINELIAPLAVGARVVVAPAGSEQDAADTLRRVAEEGVTVMEVVPSLLRVLVEDPALGRCRSLRRLQCGGEALPAAVLDRYLDAHRAELVNLYGPTEAAIEVTFWRARPLAGSRRVPIGRPIDGARAHVLGGDLRPVPPGPPGSPGPPGELYIGGDTLARGYLGRPALTAERFVPDPFDGGGRRLYRTGDLVRLGPGGELEFLGRVDLQVKLRGHRIELGEIEAALATHPAIAEAVAAVRDDAPGGPLLAAYAVAAAGAELPPPDELRRFLRQRLPAPMVPTAYVALAAVPRMPSGKADRRALPAPEAAHIGDETGYVAPRGPVEREVAAAMAKLLGRAAVGAEDDFVELGGHSLLTVRLLARLRERFGAEISFADFARRPTPAGLARRLATGRGRPGLPGVVPRPRDDRPPASLAQERVLFLQQLEPASLAYQFQELIGLDGELDAGALAAALADVCRRHEIYRTSFALDEGRPVQVIHRPGPPPLTRVDLSALPAAGREAAARRLAAGAVRARIDPFGPPLVRWTLFRVAPRRHLLLHVEHHLVHDGWAFNLFLDELFTTYRALAAGQPPPLPTPAVQFADFAAVNREWMDGPAAARQLGYWRRRLAGARPLAGLPRDRPRPPRQTFRGGVVVLDLPEAVVEPLRALGRGQGTTLFVTLFAAFAALLHRYGGERDLCVGSGAANRRWPGSEGLYGMLVNNVVLRTEVEPERGLRSLAARAREVALGAWDRQEVSFERVVEALRPERDPGANPLYQVMFSFHDSALTDLSAPGLAVSLDERIHNGSAKFDLNVIGIPHRERTLGTAARGTATEGASGSGGVLLVWEHNADLFDRTSVARMAGHFRTLAAGAGADPDRPLADLPLLSVAERQQLAGEWNDTASGYSPRATLPALFAAAAARSPDAVALVEGDASLSYRELDRRSDLLAYRLRALGVRTEMRVGLCLRRSAEAVVAMLAVVKAGGAYVPLDPEYPAERLAFMLTETAAPVLLTRSDLAGRLPTNGARLLCLDRGAPEPGPPAAVAAEDAAEDAAPLPRTGSAQALAYVMYTSGSTGEPKGVAVPHRGVARLVRGGGFADLGPEQTFLQFAPISFDASTLEIWAPLANGGRLVVMPAGRPSLAELTAAVARHGVTTLWLTAGLFHQVAEGPLGELSGLSQLLAGGDVLSPPHVARALAALPDCRLINGYGPTENTTFTCCGSLGAGDVAAAVPIGRPIADTTVYVLDRRLRPVPAGVTGELYSGGDGLARGYLHRPALTAERFGPDPFAGPSRPGARLYRTGDLVRWRGDGVVGFLGRQDGQIKLRGFRIELGEIEAALARHPAVAACCATARDRNLDDDGGGDRRLVAYWVAADPAAGPVDPGILRRHLADTLPAWMVPAAFVALDELPLNPNGKVDREALPEPDAGAVASSTAGGGYVAPRTEVEAALAGIWRELIGVERVGAGDDFFDLGGHSLHATRHLHRVRTLFGVELTLRELYEAPVLGQLAERIEERLLAEAEAAAVTAPRPTPETDRPRKPPEGIRREP